MSNLHKLKTAVTIFAVYYFIHHIFRSESTNLLHLGVDLMVLIESLFLEHS